VVGYPVCCKFHVSSAISVFVAFTDQWDVEALKVTGQFVRLRGHMLPKAVNVIWPYAPQCYDLKV
jgi:hypothetical protein